MHERFVVRLYDDALEVVPPGHFHHASTDTTEMVHHSETPKVHHSGFENALVAAGSIIGLTAVGGVILLNNHHDRKVKKRQKIDDAGSRSSEHSLQ